MRNVRRMFGPALLIAGVIALVAPTVVAQLGQKTDGSQSARGSEEARGKGKAKGITQKQRDNAEARIAAATAITDRLAADAKARGLGSGWRQATMETLLPLSLEALSQVEQQAFSVDALASAVKSVAEDPNLLGDPNADLVYTPIVPCRFIDTRNVGGKINGTVPYDTSQNGAAYGGVAACAPITVFGVVDDEQIGAIAMNVTIVDPSAAPGFLAVKPTAAAPLTSLLNWYQSGPTVQVANQGIASISQVGGTTTNFVIQTSAAVHVIVDFFGAFIEPEATALNVTTVTNSVFVAAGDTAEILSATCPAGTSMTGGGCNFGGFSSPLYFISSNPIPGSNVSWNCAVRNNSGVVGDTLTVYVRCGATPGR